MKNIFHSGRPARDGESSSLDQNIRKLPVTDWNFQTVIPALRSGSGSFGQQRKSLRALRALGESYFGDEAKRENRIESAVFGTIAALTAWPIAMAAQAIFALIK
ncbi:MAG: hypothetical protein ACXWG0_05860 [Chthoniobacterales bacterium]